MSRFRPTILGMMAVVLACGLGLAALRKPTPLAVSWSMTATLVALLSAVLGALIGRRRAFWVGFAVFGWGYALASLAPFSWNGVRPYLLTTRLLGDISKLQGLQSGGYGVDEQIYDRIIETDMSGWHWSVKGQRYQRIGHSLATILFGMVGGFLASFVDARRRAVERRGPP